LATLFDARARSVLQARPIRSSSFIKNCASLESRGYCILCERMWSFPVAGLVPK